MKAPDESGINKDFTEKSTDWIAIAGKRCTDAEVQLRTGGRVLGRGGHPCTKIRTIVRAL